MDSPQTDFLFAEPNEFFGIARLWDFGGKFDAYNYSRSVDDADAKAILSDWYIVGDDLKKAMNSFNE